MGIHVWNYEGEGVSGALPIAGIGSDSDVEIQKIAGVRKFDCCDRAAIQIRNVYKFNAASEYSQTAFPVEPYLAECAIPPELSVGRS